jgi:hypothetical protein
MVIGAGIKWFTVEVGGTAIASPETTLLANGQTYWAAQTAGTCVGARARVNIVDDCYSPFGTVFPFVYTGDDTFDENFKITAKLYMRTPADIFDLVGYIRKQAPIQTVVVEYYNCLVDDVILGAPKNPGRQGFTNNPGLQINWGDKLIPDPGVVSTETLTPLNKCTTVPIGRYKFSDIAPGIYVMEIARYGFLPRYAKIEISHSNYLGHREILGGDVNGDLVVNERDLSAFASKKGTYSPPASYNWTYDLNGDKKIDGLDQFIISFNLGSLISIYAETADWMSNP